MRRIRSSASPFANKDLHGAYVPCAGAGTRSSWCVFVCCAVTLFARYNVTAAALSDASGKVQYHEGTPIPTSLVIVAVLAVAWWRGDVGDAL